MLFLYRNLLFVLSSLGIEVAVIGRTSADATAPWCQWFPDDGGRAEIHMVNVTEEAFPLGLAIDFTSQKTFSVKGKLILDLLYEISCKSLL